MRDGHLSPGCHFTVFSRRLVVAVVCAYSRTLHRFPTPTPTAPRTTHYLCFYHHPWFGPSKLTIHYDDVADRRRWPIGAQIVMGVTATDWGHR